MNGPMYKFFPSNPVIVNLSKRPDVKDVHYLKKKVLYFHCVRTPEVMVTIGGRQS